MNVAERIGHGLRTGWSRHGATALGLGIAIMVPIATVWLAYEFWRLLSDSPAIWGTSPRGAIDLFLRHYETRRWFSGEPDEQWVNVYPPASYVLLWPLLGWLEIAPARVLWAATSIAATAWLIRLLVVESGARSRRERVFLALIPLAVYSTGATIGNGQLVVHVLPLLLAGSLLLKRAERWHDDILAASLLLLALVKPNVSAPFFWIALFVPGRLRPALLIVAAYLGLTLFAYAFQPLELGSYGTTMEASSYWGGDSRVADVSVLLRELGLGRWAPLFTLALMGALGAWTFRYRRVDVWLLLGVIAVVTRLMAYHRWYDDLLILLPLIALFRLGRDASASEGARTIAGLLFGPTWLSLLAPGGLYLLPAPWNGAYVLAQASLWLLVLVFLAVRAEQGRRAVAV